MEISAVFGPISAIQVPLRHLRKKNSSLSSLFISSIFLFSSLSSSFIAELRNMATTIRKKVDARIRTLIENGVRLRHRSMFVLVGDRGRDQIVNLHYMLSKASVRARPSVLWCYDRDLGFTTHRQKRMKKIKREIRRGLRQVDEQNPFELFVASTGLSTKRKRESNFLGLVFASLLLDRYTHTRTQTHTHRGRERERLT